MAKLVIWSHLSVKLTFHSVVEHVFESAKLYKTWGVLNFDLVCTTVKYKNKHGHLLVDRHANDEVQFV